MVTFFLLSGMVAWFLVLGYVLIGGYGWWMRARRVDKFTYYPVNRRNAPWVCYRKTDVARGEVVNHRCGETGPCNGYPRVLGGL
jgi:hypothetical protein